MAENVVGSVVGRVRFNIDKKSWDNLDLFQKKLTSIKRQMSGMDKSIKVNAVVSQINKVANATVNAEKKVAAATKASRGNVGRTNKAADLNGRLSHLFPATTLSSPAGKTVFAQMLRDEDKAAVRLERDKERAYNTRRKEVMGRRNAQLRSRAARDRQQAKLTERGNRNRTAFEAGVANFMLIKESQINQYADRNRMSREQRAEMMSRLGASRDAALKGIDPTQARAIESFRAQVNKTKNEMVNFDRITRANAVTFRSLRNEVVQLTAAYTAFSVVQNISQTGMEIKL